VEYFDEKRDEMVEGWRKLHNEELQNDQVKEDEMGRACSKHEGEEECIYSFCGKAGRRETTRMT
jgi:hypothetical protein